VANADLFGNLLVDWTGIYYESPSAMGLGTKNRKKQTADICKQHLREKYREKLGLVEASFWRLRVHLKTM
jgi:hypothetical protein